MAEKTYEVEIRTYDDELVEQITDEPVTKRTAERIKRGADANLNHDKYYVGIFEV